MIAGGALLCATAAHAASFYVVDNSTVNCSDSGPGTVAVPYCTITAAVNAHGGPGVTIYVKPGVYREQVTVPVSGAAGNPFVIQALGTPVVLDGADDFSSGALWANVSGDIWLASSVTWQPVQVIVDDTRLNTWASDPLSLPPSSFRYVSGQGLYVNLGGGSPGTHDTRVSVRQHGFRLPGRSWVTIDGFSVTRTQDHGIYLIGPASDLTVINNQVTLTGHHGIGVVGCSSVEIANNVVHNNGDHGISLISGVTNSTIENNESYGNARFFESAASGIYLHGSANNLVQSNRCHDNQDTGVEIDSLSDNVLCRQNLAWNNGDHGFSHLRSSNVTHVGDVAWGNFHDGFSVEGNAPGATLYDCIAANNGLTTGYSDLLVDASSISNLTSDYNIFWNSTGVQPVRYNGVRYATVAAYAAASGQDAHTLQANPQFVGPVTGDFRLFPNSPAIDSGYSLDSGWPALDADGHARYDDPATTNTGVGSISYADRGALEYQGQQQTGVGDTPSIDGLSFSPAFPNPSNGRVSFALDLPRATLVHWSVIDVQGRTVWTQSVQGAAGRLILGWNGTDRSGSVARPGLYMARARVGEILFARRFLLVR